MYEIQVVIWYALTAVFIVAVCYAGSRAASVAYFRTKLEYIRSVIREGSERNGK